MGDKEKFVSNNCNYIKRQVIMEFEVIVPENLPIEDLSIIVAEWRISAKKITIDGRKTLG